MKPKIVIDGISLLSSLTGIGRYTYEVSKEIEKSAKFQMHYFYGTYSDTLIHPSTGTNLKNLKSILSKFSMIKNLIRELLFISSRLFASRYELYWQPNFIPHRGVKAHRTITTVHDFSFIVYKEFHTPETVKYFDKYFFRNIDKSDMIITGSEYTKKEILQRTKFTADKIRVIYHGINHNLFRVYENKELDFELPNKFILSVGSIEPRKNLIGLLKAYISLDKRIKKEYKLILVGFRGWENREIITLIEDNKEDVNYLGFISDEELAKVYNRASCFAYPSFYEGFGLPVLEAMACGTPVVCSNASSLPEVGQDAVVYCNPNNTKEIKEKIESVLEDKTLQTKMIKRGLEIAKEFSWEKSARKHMELFQEVLNS